MQEVHLGQPDCVMLDHAAIDLASSIKANVEHHIATLPTTLTCKQPLLAYCPTSFHPKASSDTRCKSHAKRARDNDIYR